MNDNVQSVAFVAHGRARDTLFGGGIEEEIDFCFLFFLISRH